MNGSRKKATTWWLNIIEKTVKVAAFPGITGSIAKFYYDSSKIVTTVVVLITILVMYVIWIECRLRSLESKRK